MMEGVEVLRLALGGRCWSSEGQVVKQEKCLDKLLGLSEPLFSKKCSGNLTVSNGSTAHASKYPAPL